MTDVKRAAEIAEEARKNIAKVIHGQTEAVDFLLIALATGGHALLEGVPGVGKTSLAKAFAATSGIQFKRIQLTPDLMPSDITGHTFFNPVDAKFEIRKGPVFTNLLLADEINRAPPRTQSALLEVMEENQVTIEGTLLPVPSPFIVLATKNPIDIEGVYPLPEAQLDRFMLFIHLDYPESAVEKQMLLGKLGRPSPLVAIPGMAETLRKGFQSVRAHPDIVQYVLDIVRATRTEIDVQLGAGPRASEHLLAASRATALLQGRDYVIPDDVKRMAVVVLAHRLMLNADAEIKGTKATDIVRGILDRIPVPLESK